MTVFNLLVGGPTSEWPDTLKAGTVTGQWIGGDRGTLRLLDLGIDPVVAIGDFDSLSQSEYERVRAHVGDIRAAVPEKDETDTELAVTVAFRDYHATQLNIYGATGGRLDHLLANLWLVLKPRYRQHAHQIRFIDRQNTVTFYLPGNHEIQKEPDKKYLAFVPLEAVANLTLPDEKYQLDHEMVPYPISYASNEFMGSSGHFSFTSGLLAVIQSKD
ncbi:thiamine diphosphokinase [Secundilactobacillus kimchicus]|uniref:Thiamine diphosphokinase n=1 Tax=Secundilactobacillus kimchicus JCM 15530 TaxID=1302272 RepID=A0A0R1HS17_9LACO|nr:thiamine diphosphokinase [Secundilactobacillus kimchicus]KRK49288.1 thiamine pyrophosphokinase [Secundilactobacillus kimchicus JCM 15530]MBT9672835.1 thiamine diphosphokinase [Secundilactobacillus kimchicus]